MSDPESSWAPRISDPIPPAALPDPGAGKPTYQNLSNARPTLPVLSRTGSLGQLGIGKRRCHGEHFDCRNDYPPPTSSCAENFTICQFHRIILIRWNGVHAIVLSVSLTKFDSNSRLCARWGSEDVIEGERDVIARAGDSGESSGRGEYASRRRRRQQRRCRRRWAGGENRRRVEWDGFAAVGFGASCRRDDCPCREHCQESSSVHCSAP